MNDIAEITLLKRALWVAAENHLRDAGDSFMPFMGTHEDAVKQLVEMWLVQAKGDLK